MELSPQEIERRRDNANQLVAEGRLGGAEYGRLGGRPRKQRASEIIAEKVSSDAELIYARLKEIVETGNDSNAISSIKTLLGIEETERKVEEEKEMRFEQLRRDELIKYLATTLGELQGQGIFPAGIIDAEFEPVEHRAIASNGSSNESPSEPS